LNSKLDIIKAAKKLYKQSGSINFKIK